MSGAKKVPWGVTVAMVAVFVSSGGWGLHAADEPAYVDLFNGRNLDGWVNVNCEPDTWQVRDGILVCSGEPQGFIRNDKMYENFVLEIEWRHAAPGGNSGIFFHADASPKPGAPSPRCFEAQLLDGDHGSLFGIRGASLTPVTNAGKKGKTAAAKPIEDRCKPAGEWNRYVITSRDGTAELAVNGKVVTQAKGLSQVKGYIGLQSEHSEIHFRKIRVKPLPSSNPPADKTAQAASDTWRAGVATKVITPQGPMWMSGYARRKKPATQTEHDLQAKGLALVDPHGKRAVLVTLDLCGIDRTTTLAICKALMKKHKLKRSEIALNCSHNHCGPAVGHNLAGLFFFSKADRRMVDKYTIWLSAQVVAVVDVALGKIAPAKLTWGEGFSDIAVNRRENPHDEVVKLRAEGKLKGPSDHSVPVMRVTDADGMVTAILAGYACHPTKLMSEFDRWCGDYVGFAKLAIEKTHPGAVAMFWQGCGGDQTPWPRGGADVAQAQEVGEGIAAAVEAALGKKLAPVGGRLFTRYAELDLPLSELPTREKLEASTRGKNEFKARHAKNILSRLDAGKKVRASYEAYPIQTWQLGSGLQWIFLGGEVVVDYSLRFKKEFGETNTWVAGYTNDVMAYIPSERVLKEGGYEGWGAMVYYDLPAPWAAGVERRIADEVQRQLNRKRKN